MVIYADEKQDFTKYVNPLMGTMSSFELSAGNTYPAIAMPWGMNFWTPRTSKTGDGWQYTYTANKIYGFEQTHQPSPWINDYGQFSLMPVVGMPAMDEEQRASWFSHKSETALPHYYKVYLADYDITTELAPTERAAMFRFTFPQAESYVVIDAHATAVAFPRTSATGLSSSSTHPLNTPGHLLPATPHNVCRYKKTLCDRRATTPEPS